MLLPGLFPSASAALFPLAVQPSQIDSLEPSYPCPAADKLISDLTSPSNPKWKEHLDAASSLFRSLDSMSGVLPSDYGFHKSFDHYFDNLSSRQCHGLPLPCSEADPSNCVSQEQADTVYRLGMHEYSYMYRGSEDALKAAVLKYGAFFVEHSAHIREALNGGQVKYRHNVAHDGSIARVLSVLQVENMVWPGMGAEVVWEIYRVKNVQDNRKFALRVLWGGNVLHSSHPELGVMNMIDLEIWLRYVHGLVGEKGSKIVEGCKI